MVDQPMVVVRGEATRQVPPEQALVSVTVSARDKDRQTTLTRLTERAAQVRALLDEYAEAIERRETEGVTVYPETTRRSGERVTAYVGRVGTTVVVTDFTVLGPLLLRLGGQEQTAVAGPWWQLKPGSRAGAEVRGEAIADALGRAREYAAAVGATVDRLIEISDEGVGGGPMNLSMTRGMAKSADSAPQLDLDPEEQTVQASVIVRVAITEPTALG